MRNHIAEHRTWRGWTQQDLAQQLGVSRQTIISIERGRHDPALALAFRLAALFETSVDALFEPDAGNAGD
ncbi:helix-turn-helix transcriptional regulator [Nocardioides zeae]|uniref:Transcriptional regulator n=1 Tax=Nocardioides zeae TaxID=1457234 RepID=A0AAJ1U8K2_9ACTN|nr:helix-turn-helix transcriptional regulator [Nocardioides zeae]MDQ1106361.1 putative transcriptional regulator [Nocardioides zeae]